MIAALETDPLVAQTVERVLADVCTPDAVEHAETDGWCASVWDALAGAGFPLVSVPEEFGGSGGTLADAASILRCVGRHAAPTPVAETGMLAGWMLAGSGLHVPDGPTTVVTDPTALSVIDGRLRGTAVVAWAVRSARIVALVDDGVRRLVVGCRPDQVQISPGSNLAGEPRDAVVFDVELSAAETVVAGPGIDADAFMRRGALSRLLMSAGALGALAQMTVDYTNERRQFGKPVATFQAVQHHLVTVAECAVRADIAAEAALRAVARGSTGIEIASARLVVDAAIANGTRAAHQAHGAMGVTREYPLHHLSRRLWAWRHEYGSAAMWRRRVGSHALATGADGLMPLITR